MDRYVEAKTGKFDVVGFANDAAKNLDNLNQHIELIGRILHSFAEGQQKNVKKDTRRILVGQSVGLNFAAQSVYVDNSQGTQSVTLVTDKDVSYTVAANTQAWVHPLGCANFDVTGTAGESCPAMFVDTLILAK